MKPKRKEKKMLPVRIIANRRIGELKAPILIFMHGFLCKIMTLHMKYDSVSWEQKTHLFVAGSSKCPGLSVYVSWHLAPGT